MQCKWKYPCLLYTSEFPLKDPFVEMVNGSLNTFLNAMTYPDKTCYPVASCNDRDFQNLMHVQRDAVCYPNIYKKEEIFRQEGWNYHLEKKEGPLKYNGVVYNEMKGAFSSPDDVLAVSYTHLIQIPAGIGFMQGIFVEYGITVDDDADAVRNGGFGSTTK